MVRLSLAFSCGAEYMYVYTTIRGAIMARTKRAQVLMEPEEYDCLEEIGKAHDGCLS